MANQKHKTGTISGTSSVFRTSSVKPMKVHIQLSKVRFFLLLTLTAVGFFLGGYVSRDQNIVTFSTLNGKPRVYISRELPKSKQTLDFSLFWQVWDKLYADYYAREKLDPEKLIYGAISGMVAATGDPYTIFLSPSDQRRNSEDLRGSFEGVGIQIGFKGTQLAVMAPLENSPAKEAGVQGGDFIIAIKDKNKNIDKGTAGMNLLEAVDAIRGPAGTKVTLTLLRNGVEKPFEVELTRKTIDVPSVIVNYEKEDTIVHLKLTTFGGETQKEWEKAVNEIARKGTVKYIVFDLRNNTGGYLTGAVFIASEFLKDGVVVVEEDASGKQTKLEVDRKGKLTNLPVVVLVNKGSASASEIVAGALRDHKRTKLIGETTFGKGTIQGVEQLSGGAGLHITTAKWLTPNGTWVHDKGLEPDVNVEDKNDTTEDEQLQKAIEFIVQ